MKNPIKILIGTIDKLIVKHTRWNHIPYSNNNFFYLNPHIYKGKTITLKDGTCIKRGDYIAEIHIDNSSVNLLDTRYPNLIRLLEGELASLKKALLEGNYPNIKAIYGLTVFYNIVSRHGFTIIDERNAFVKLFGSIWENILRLSLKSQGKKTRKKFLFSKQCWFSREQILSLK